MPKIIYLKDLCSGQAGTIHDLQDYEAKVLIQLGAAADLPLNLNGTPVVDDFGGIVLATVIPESPVSRGRKKTKG